MSRINTNVSSLVAQNTLGRSNSGLNEALTRLSTGLRINTGKDDPAGLIASENLRSDITSIRRAISNTERAVQVIATADSSLGQVSSLLNDIRGLVTESANAGALSDEQIAANQLQLDSSLEALNRIAQTTTFQGRRLLDGSLDFVTNAGTNFSNITDLKIDQANLGATGSVSVDISVTTAATQAQVDVTSVPVTATAVGSSTNGVTTNAEVDVVVSVGLSGDTITITGAAGEGDTYNGITGIAVNFGEASAAAAYDSNTGVLTVDVTQADGVATTANIAAAIAGEAEFQSASSDGTATVSAAQVTASTTAVTTDGRDAGSSTISLVSADIAVDADGATVTFVEANTVTTAAPTAVVDGSGNLTITVNDTGTTALSDVIAAIDAEGTYDATLAVGSGDGNYDAAAETVPTFAAFSGFVDAGGIENDVVLEVSGSNGSEVLSFGAGTSIDDVVQGINLVSDATGVTATANGTTLELTSSTYGSDSLVDVNVLSEGTGATAAGTFTTAIADGQRVTGTDIVATLNGVVATGDGNDISINTASLDLQATLTAGFTGTASFTISGGGALFQLGPDVVSNQQARLGVGSVNTARLGGSTGKLFQLGTGGSAALATDANTAAQIVEEAIDQVTGLRGRLGAFQRTTLETNKNALNDTLVNLTEAESTIRDADFAEESAALTRAQILVQSGTTVLSIANQNPQNVLALLR